MPLQTNTPSVYQSHPGLQAIPMNYPMTPPNRDIEREGCFSCRWRKKKCKITSGDGPSASKPCGDCKRFNILCQGAGDERPGGKDLAAAVRKHTKAWISEKANRTSRHPLDLTPLWQASMAASTPFIYVQPLAGGTSGLPPHHHHHHHHHQSSPPIISYSHYQTSCDAVPPLFHPYPASHSNDSFAAASFADAQLLSPSYDIAAYPDVSKSYGSHFATTTSVVSQQGLLTPDMGQDSPPWAGSSQYSPYANSVTSFDYSPSGNTYQSGGSYYSSQGGSPPYDPDDFSPESSQESAYQTMEMSNRYSSSGVHNWRSS